MLLKYMNAKPIQVTTTAKEISESLNTPYDTTSKMMQTLKKSGVLSSIQGVKGGYSLAKPLNEVSYYDFAKSVGEDSMGLDCLSGSCDMQTSCNISTPMKKLNTSLIDFFSKLTLKELLA